MIEKLIKRTILNGVLEVQEGDNLDNNAVSVWKSGVTITTEEVCVNQYNRVFSCAGEIRKLSFAPSEVAHIEDGWLGVFLYDELN